MKLVDILARELKAWPEGFGEYCISTFVEGAWAAWFNERRPAKHIQGGWTDVGRVEWWLSEKPEDAEYAIVTREEWQAAVEALKAEQVAYSYENSDVNASFASLTEYPANAECKIIAPKEADQAAELKWPDGAEFMGTTDKGYPNVFYRNVGDGAYEYLYAANGRISEWKLQHGNPARQPLISRPTERAVEWDGVGLPPVGTVVHTDHKCKEMAVKILAYGDHHKDKCVLVADMSHGFEGKMFGWIVAKCVFRQIRTQEQIDAEDREKAIKQICIDAGSPELTAGQLKVAEKLYQAGYRKQVAE